MDPRASRNPDTNRFGRDPRPTNENPNFVQDYFASSRLHFIGSFRARYESMMVSVGKSLQTNPANLLQPAPPPPKPRDRIILHIDMDCFFASVAITKDPSLKGKCIAVSHGGGEISTCSYEARKFGVRAGMFFKNALAICPALISVPYDFPTYEQISIQIYAAFYDNPSVTVEAVSVDEAYLDLTSALPAEHTDPATTQTAVETMVRNLRTRIFQQTGCSASAGIGPSKLVARLATKAAKPNGQITITQHNLIHHLDTLSVKDLPGIGWRTSRRLADMRIETCPQLRALPLQQLQAEFGEKQGLLFHHMARGLDSRPVQPLKPRKSIGAEASWGVRFRNEQVDKANKFIVDMADLVASRVDAAGASASRMSFKLYRKKPNSSMEGYKYLGHGPCIILTRSCKLAGRCSGTTLKHALRDACLRLFNELDVRNEDFRGLGLQVTDLTFSDLSFDVVKAQTAGATRRIDSFFNANPDARVGKPQSISAPRVDGPSELGCVPDAEVADEEASVRDDEIKPVVSKGGDVNGRAGSGSGKGAVQVEKEVSVLEEIEEDRIEVGRAEDVDKRKASEEHDCIPTGWDKEVFKGLPEEIREELIKEHRKGSDVAAANVEVICIESEDESPPEKSPKRHRIGEENRNESCGNAEKRSRKSEVAQITMTQFAAISKLKKKGNDVLNAEEFQTRRLGECIRLMEDCNPKRPHERGLETSKMARKVGFVKSKQGPGRESMGNQEVDWDIPSPPSLSSDSEDGNEMTSVIAKEGWGHKQIYADEDVSDYAPKLKLWMGIHAADIKSGHEELLRGRVLELVHRKRLERVCVEMRTIGAFAKEGKLREWGRCYNSLVDDVENCCHRLYGYRLALRKIGR